MEVEVEVEQLATMRQTGVDDAFALQNPLPLEVVRLFNSSSSLLLTKQFSTQLSSDLICLRLSR